MSTDRDEKATWDGVKELIGDQRLELGLHWSYNLRNDPKRLAFVLSRYKFAAKMACHGRRVLELGCSEGLGAPILSEFARAYTGVDLDGGAIESAKRNWGSDSVQFHQADFLEGEFGAHDTIVSMDVIEHIEPAREHLFFTALTRHLEPEGIAVIGTPNITSAPYASAASQAGHVNMFSGERLEERLREHFQFVFPFGMNDELVHTGYTPMCQFLIALACRPKRAPGD